MTIEKEIKQKSFENEYHKAHVNLIFTAAWISLRMNQVLKPFGISMQQFNILRILKGRRKEPASIRELTERMLDKSSNASRLVDKLFTKGLVRKENCVQDGRRTNVLITSEGLKLIDDASVVVSAFISDTFQTLTEEEAMVLNRLLDQLRD